MQCRMTETTPDTEALDAHAVRASIIPNALARQQQPETPALIMMLERLELTPQLPHKRHLFQNTVKRSQWLLHLEGWVRPKETIAEPAIIKGKERVDGKLIRAL